jgi:ribosome-binding protein aMBF1 (putative translation factor)
MKRHFNCNGCGKQLKGNKYINIPIEPFGVEIAVCSDCYGKSTVTDVMATHHMGCTLLAGYNTTGELI